MKCALGIDLGGTVIKAGLVCDGELLSYATFASDSVNGLGNRLPRIRQQTDALLARHGVTPGQLAGIGVAFPGIVDVRNRRVLSTNQKYDDAPHIDLPGWVRENWGCDCFLDNDARMSLVAEWKYGEGRGSDDIVMMTLGTGIGTAVVQNGRLMRGIHGQGGCLGGHFTVHLDGRPCSCGNKGCVEAESGSRSLPLIARETEGFAQSPLSRAEQIDFRTLFRLAGAGDSFSIRLRDRCLDIWGTAVVNYIHAYDPEVVILGGGIMKSRETILPHLQNFVDRYAWTPSAKVRLKCSDMYETAALLGAAHCITDKQLQ